MWLHKLSYYFKILSYCAAMNYDDTEMAAIIPTWHFIGRTNTAPWMLCALIVLAKVKPASKEEIVE